MHNRGDRDRQKQKEESVAAKCRERRRRRIEMRRAMTPATNNNNNNNNSSSTLKSPAAYSPDNIDAAEAAVPNCGSMSLAGRMRQMEDAITIKMNLCRLPHQDNRPLHFFAVYDGHGGPHVASYCRERMHVYMREELMRGEGQEMTEEWWQQAMKRCFKRMDKVVLSTCACGNIGYDCGAHPSDEMGLVGSTAVVALLTPDHIFVANCGDSRAVLSSGGKVIPLSHDQKPNRADELGRIQSLGGRVIELNGARVEGILAMSRAIGDKFLKTFVISEPEILFAKREPDGDEFLILASDGLWDVVPSDVACNIVRDCLQEGNVHPSSSDDPSSSVGPRVTDQGAGVGTTNPSRIASAAALLTRMALGRESSDNISVIVVDLKCSF